MEINSFRVTVDDLGPGLEWVAGDFGGVDETIKGIKNNQTTYKLHL